MKTNTMRLNIRHLTEDTVDDLRRNDLSNKNKPADKFIGTVIQFTTSGDILITVDTDIIDATVLRRDAIDGNLGIPSDLRLCLFYAFDHNCDSLLFVQYGENENPLLPAYIPTKLHSWVKYNGINIQMKDWPGELIPD